ncbi:hypothetical protein R1flu_003941 [Riccia fluitans]|uniref:Uncharacterized protein n=1 Tax=Riccia fluitans TaxID=41844 RepID=A0ABD1XDV6_9MARC
MSFREGSKNSRASDLAKPMRYTRQLDQICEIYSRAPSQTRYELWLKSNLNSLDVEDVWFSFIDYERKRTCGKCTRIGRRHGMNGSVGQVRAEKVLLFPLMTMHKTVDISPTTCSYVFSTSWNKAQTKSVVYYSHWPWRIGVYLSRGFSRGSRAARIT